MSPWLLEAEALCEEALGWSGQQVNRSTACHWVGTLDLNLMVEIKGFPC